MGFEQITVRADGSLTARKPWPTGMDAWSHPRHGADGNPVSHDTTVGPPERVRWIAAALEEVEGLVTEAGRNFYGGILARDSFNGLRLWDNDLEKGTLNNANFRLPGSTTTSTRPRSLGKVCFCGRKGKFSALNAVSGEVVRIYDGIEDRTSSRTGTSLSLPMRIRCAPLASRLGKCSGARRLGIRGISRPSLRR